MASSAVFNVYINFNAVFPWNNILFMSLMTDATVHKKAIALSFYKSEYKMHSKNAIRSDGNYEFQTDALFNTKGSRTQKNKARLHLYFLM